MQNLEHLEEEIATCIRHYERRKEPNAISLARAVLSQRTSPFEERKN